MRKTRFFYYESEGAIFRQPEGFAGVTHVKINGEWEPYDGDAIRPIHFGNPINAEGAGEALESDAYAAE